MQSGRSGTSAITGAMTLWAWELVDSDGSVLMRGQSLNYLDALARALAAQTALDDRTPPPPDPPASPRRDRRARRRRT